MKNFKACNGRRSRLLSLLACSSELLKCFLPCINDGLSCGEPFPQKAFIALKNPHGMRRFILVFTSPNVHRMRAFMSARKLSVG